MAKLKINSDIISEDDRQMLSLWFGYDTGVSYDSIESFLESIPKDDNEIDIAIHCNGGEVMEGWSIYDKLRASGKEISATIEGKCASMASILLLAAPKERRYARPNASLLIHEPYMSFLCGNLTADELARQAEAMRKESDKIVACYVERTGTDEQTLRDLMKEDKFIDMDKAHELGFISTILEPITAKATTTKTVITTPATNAISINQNINNQSLRQMSNKTKEPSALDKAMARLGYQPIQKSKAVGLELTTDDGTMLTIETDGDPQVGDKASPDGEHKMQDSRVITVKDGEITEIQEVTTTPANEDEDALKEKIVELQELVTELTELQEETNNKLADTNSKLVEATKQVNSLTATQITEEQKDILNKVQDMGGITKLRAMHSTYVPTSRQQTQTTAFDKTTQPTTHNRLREQIENLKQKEGK